MHNWWGRRVQDTWGALPLCCLPQVLAGLLPQLLQALDHPLRIQALWQPAEWEEMEHYHGTNKCSGTQPDHSRVLAVETSRDTRTGVSTIEARTLQVCQYRIC